MWVLQRRGVVGVLVASVVAVVAVTLAVPGRPANRLQPLGSTATNPLAAYDYGPLDCADDENSHPRERLEASVRQWPGSSRERMRGMADRLSHVTDVINQASGAQCVVMLGQTGGAGMSSGSGVITVDTTVLWQVSEDALAALLAHELAHEQLGHRNQMEQLEKEKGQPGYAQRVRAIEQAADETAGQILARTSYRPEGFDELLGQVRSTEWETPLVRQYYPHPSRRTVFQQGYERERARRIETTAVTSRPTQGNDSQSAPGGSTTETPQ